MDEDLALPVPSGMDALTHRISVARLQHVSNLAWCLGSWLPHLVSLAVLLIRLVRQYGVMISTWYRLASHALWPLGCDLDLGFLVSIAMVSSTWNIIFNRSTKNLDEGRRKAAEDSLLHRYIFASYAGQEHSEEALRTTQTATRPA